MAPKSGRGKANKTKAEKKRKEEKGLIRFHFLLTKKFLYIFFVFLFSLFCLYFFYICGKFDY